jgi:hypothetical protein
MQTHLNQVLATVKVLMTLDRETPARLVSACLPNGVVAATVISLGLLAPKLMFGGLLERSVGRTEAPYLVHCPNAVKPPPTGFSVVARSIDVISLLGLVSLFAAHTVCRGRPPLLSQLSVQPDRAVHR